MIFDGKDVRVLLARAGTGKTTRLIDIIEEELKERRPEELAFVTFTRKGAEEGIQRTCSRFLYEPDELPYFCTLHSLTFRALNLKYDNVWHGASQKQFNKIYGYKVNREEVESRHEAPTLDTEYLNYYDLERSGALQTWQMSEANIDKVLYSRLVRDYNEFKKTQHLVDFYDCLIKYVQDGSPLPCRVVLCDECQDFTLLQWTVIEKAFANAEKVYLAGDSEQGIYTYSGARPDLFIKLSKTYPTEFLSESYRLPRKVWQIGRGLLGMMAEKSEMPFNFRKGNPEGYVQRLNDIESLARNTVLIPENREKAQWYFLCRNRCFIPLVTEIFHETFTPYWTAEGFCVPKHCLQLIKAYTEAQNGHVLPAKTMALFRDRYGITDFSQPFMDTSLFNPKSALIYYGYIQRWGLRQLIEMSRWNPQILVSTIHHVKGGEADNVALLLNASKKSIRTLFTRMDEELRLLYVAVTRSRQNLYIVDNRKGQKSYSKIFDALNEEEESLTFLEKEYAEEEDVNDENRS